MLSTKKEQNAAAARARAVKYQKKTVGASDEKVDGIYY